MHQIHRPMQVYQEWQNQYCQVFYCLVRQLQSMFYCTLDSSLRGEAALTVLTSSSAPRITTPAPTTMLTVWPVVPKWAAQNSGRLIASASDILVTEEKLYGFPSLSSYHENEKIMLVKLGDLGIGLVATYTLALWLVVYVFVRRKRKREVLCLTNAPSVSFCICIWTQSLHRFSVGT